MHFNEKYKFITFYRIFLYQSVVNELVSDNSEFTFQVKTDSNTTSFELFRIVRNMSFLRVVLEVNRPKIESSPNEVVFGLDFIGRTSAIYRLY